MYKQDQPEKRKIMIIIGISVLVFIAIIVVISLLFIKNKEDEAPAQPVSVSNIDPDSGERYDDTTFTPETYGTRGDLPLILGTTFFIEIGLTQDQVYSIRDQIIEFYDQQKSKEKIEKISVRKDSFRQNIKDDGSTEYTFTLVIDEDTELDASATTTGVDSADLTLQKDGVELFPKKP